MLSGKTKKQAPQKHPLLAFFPHPCLIFSQENHLQTRKIQLKSNNTILSFIHSLKRHEQIPRPFFLILFLIPLKAFASWQDHENAPALPATEHIRPKHVYALASLLAEEIESVRYLMGITKINDSLLQVTDAEPREVYFQAVNLYGKINRLHHNLTARSLADHDLPAIQQNIRPADVWEVLAVTLDQLDEIKDEYGISTHSPFPDLREKNSSYRCLSIPTGNHPANQPNAGGAPLHP